MPMATFPKIFNELLFRPNQQMCMQNLKSAAFPIPEVIGGTQKIGQSQNMPTIPFL